MLGERERLTEALGCSEQGLGYGNLSKRDCSQGCLATRVTRGLAKQKKTKLGAFEQPARCSPNGWPSRFSGDGRLSQKDCRSHSAG